jgi:hypothetical protein
LVIAGGIADPWRHRRASGLSALSKVMRAFGLFDYYSGGIGR